MSNVAIVQEGFIREDLCSALKVVTLPILKTAPREVVVYISMHPIQPYDFFWLSYEVYNDTPGCKGFGIVHEVYQSSDNFVTVSLIHQ